MSLQALLLRSFLRLTLRPFGPMMQSVHRGVTSIEAVRRYSASGDRFTRLPRGVSVQQMNIGPLPARWITPAGVESSRTLLYLHGGGWVFGWAALYGAFVGQLARAVGVRALGIDYRLAPEHPFPAALDDCLSAYAFLLDQNIPARQIVVMGDSAGGNLTLALLLSLKERGMPLPAAGVCLSPATDLASRGDSFRANLRSDVVLPVALVDYAAASYAANHDLRDPLLSPLYGDLQGLPPLLIQAGGGELLLDDARAFAARAAGCGVDVTFTVYPGMWHVWQPFAPFLPEARRAVEEITRFVHARLPG